MFAIIFEEDRRLNKDRKGLGGDGTLVTGTGLPLGDQGHLPDSRGRLSPHEPSLGNGDDCTFGADGEGATLRIGADGVELGVGFLLGADASGIFGWAEIVDEIGAHEE